MENKYSKECKQCGQLMFKIEDDVCSRCKDKIINAYWFTNAEGCIGIVLVDTVQGLKAYIGQAKGENKKEDIEHIAKWGAKFTLDAVMSLLNNYVKYGDADGNLKGTKDNVDINELNYKLSAE